MSPIAVRTVTPAQHLAYVNDLPGASFLQTPAWAAVKSEWNHESIGWFADDELVGVGLVLYRQLPKVKRYLAYLPEGPLLDWSSPRLDDMLTAMAAHLKAQGAFGVRMGPPVVVRRWSAETIKQAISGEEHQRLGTVPADDEEPTGATVRAALSNAGWLSQAGADGFSAGQPQYVFQIPLAGRTAEDVLAGMNQLWRRNIKKAAKLGVEVSRGGAADLADFHQLYRRDGRNATASRPAPSATSRPCSPPSPPRTRTGSGSTWRTTRASSLPRPPGCGWATTSGTPTAPRRRPSATCAAPTPSSGR